MNVHTLKEWLLPDEELQTFIEEEGILARQILVLTSKRAILFTATLFQGLNECSDKLWSQFISVHLQDGFFSASLTVQFSHLHLQNNLESQIDTWVFDDLPRHQAKSIYRVLKEKECRLKELREAEKAESAKTKNKKYLEIRTLPTLNQPSLMI